jgi:PhnB protein
MKQLIPYLMFNGNCEDAINFYQKCFDGEVLFLQRFGDAGIETDEADKEKIMHASLKAEGINLMFSDSSVSSKVEAGSNTHLSIDFSDEEVQKKVYDRLSEGGNVTMPLQDTFWGAKFAMITDQFGINWMLNCDKPQ